MCDERELLRQSLSGKPKSELIDMMIELIGKNAILTVAAASGRAARTEKRGGIAISRLANGCLSGLTEAARRIGIDRSYLSRVLRGKLKDYKDCRGKLAEAGITVDL